MKDATQTLPEPLVMVSPEWLGGQPCFTGLRVPVSTMFDYLKAGQSLEIFLEDFPSVTRGHAEAVIDLASHMVRFPDAAE